MRLRHAGHVGGQRVVVADFDLVDRHRIVFVDDRDHAVLQQGFQRVPGIEIAPAVFEVIMTQKNLRHLEPLLLERPLIRTHQETLADGGTGLLFRNS